MPDTSDVAARRRPPRQPARFRRFRSSRGTGSLFDSFDVVVVLASAVVASAFLVIAAIADTQQPGEAAPISRVMPIPSGTPSARATDVARVDLIASSTQQAEAFGAGITAQTELPVRLVVGGSYASAQHPYASAATRLDRASTLVVIVPSVSDLALTPLQWQGPLARTGDRGAAGGAGRGDPARRTGGR
jgi:hypothetical protein